MHVTSSETVFCKTIKSQQRSTVVFQNYYFLFICIFQAYKLLFFSFTKNVYIAIWLNSVASILEMVLILLLS